MVNLKLTISIETAVKAILKNRRRSFLTVIGIIVGIAAVITIMTVGRGYEKYSLKQLLDSDDIKNNRTSITFSPEDEDNFNKSSFNFFNERDLDLIRSIPGVSKVNYQVESPDKIYRQRSVLVDSSTQNEKVHLVNGAGNKVDDGKDLSKSDIGNKVVTISDNLAKRLFPGLKSATDAVGKTVEIDNESFLIQGIFGFNVSDNVQIEMNKETYLNYFRGTDKKIFKLQFLVNRILLVLLLK